GDRDLVAHAAAVLAEALRVALHLLGDQLEEWHVVLVYLLLAEVGHGGEERPQGMLAVAVRPGPAAHAVQVGADVADEIAVLGDAAEQERVDLEEPVPDHRYVLLRAVILRLGKQRLYHSEGLERSLQALAQRRVKTGVDA